MNQIKLVVFDVDGTLVPRGSNQIVPSAIQAIKQLKENGYEILIATGRPFYFVLDTVKETVNPDYYVTINGTCLLDKTGTIIETHHLDFTTVETLIRLAKEYQFSLGFKYADVLRVYNQYERFVSLYAKDHPEFKKDIIEDFDKYYQQQLPLGGFFFSDDIGLEAVKQALPELPIAPAVKGAYDLYPTGVDKTKTIETVLNKLNITWEQVISFGDGENDIDMLQKAKIGVAMGNASAIVKNHADYITKDILEDGILHALKQFELLK